MDVKRIDIKRFAVIFIAVVLGAIMFMQPVFAQPWVHTETFQSTIGSGVTHQQILRFGETGWQQINVIRIDLKDENTELKLLQSDKGVSSRDTLSNMMSKLEMPIAGINTDFFYLTQPDSPLGIMIREGQLVSSQVIDRPFSSLRVSLDGFADLVSWRNNSYVTTESGTVFNVETLNKITWNYHRLTVFDKNWGPMSPGAADDYHDLVEVVVVDNVVQEVRRGLGPVMIPENGFILLASGHQGSLLAEGVRPGEKVVFHQHITPDINNTKIAVGGGTVLVQNGLVVPFSEPVTGNHPRTAVGINSTGSELMMVTVDGRHKSFVGVDGNRLANIMIELGSRQAILMDGGGSTTMAIRALGEHGIMTANNPSDGSQRRIINGLAVVSRAPAGALQGILFDNDQHVAFVNQSIDLAVRGYDGYYNPLLIDAGQVSYRVVEGKGRIAGQKLVPEETGVVIVEASVGGTSARKEMSVLGDVAGLQVHVPKYSLNPGESMKLMVEGIDKNGYRAPLDVASIQFTDSSGLGNVSNGSYVAALQTGATTLRASYNDFHATIPLTIGLERKVSGSLDGYTPVFLGYPSTVMGRVRIVSDSTHHSRAVELAFDLTQVGETAAAYVEFSNGGIPIPRGTNRIAIEVNAENTAPHWIRGQVKDANGQAHIIDFKQGIDWTGWKTLEAPVPQNLTHPLMLDRVYVVETASYKTSGILLFDNIEFLLPYTLPVLSMEDKGGRMTDHLKQTPSNMDKKWIVHGGTANEHKAAMLWQMTKEDNLGVLLTGTIPLSIRNQPDAQFIGGIGGYQATPSSDVMVVSLDNSSDGLRKTNFQQWPWLLNLLKASLPDNIVFLLPKPISGPTGFSDDLEAELLMNQISDLSKRGKNVFVIYGSDSQEEEVMNGVRLIGTGKDENQTVELYLSENQLFYGRSQLGMEVSSQQSEDHIPASGTTHGGVAFKIGQPFYTIDNAKVQMDTSPYIKDSRLMIPVSHAATALGISKDAVAWDASSQTVLIRAGEGKNLLLTIGSRQLWVEDQVVEMDTVAEISDSRTFIPISWFANALGKQFNWNPTTETVRFQ